MKDSTWDQLSYFWKIRGDLDRMSGLEEAFGEFPKIGRAWRRYKRLVTKAKGIMNEAFLEEAEKLAAKD